MKQEKVYDFKMSQEVIEKAWAKAMKHLSKKLGDQFNQNCIDSVKSDFFDKVEQDITFKSTCVVCGVVDLEGNFYDLACLGGNVCVKCSNRRGVNFDE